MDSVHRSNRISRETREIKATSLPCVPGGMANDPWVKINTGQLIYKRSLPCEPFHGRNLAALYVGQTKIALTECFVGSLLIFYTRKLTFSHDGVSLGKDRIKANSLIHIDNLLHLHVAERWHKTGHILFHSHLRREVAVDESQPFVGVCHCQKCFL